MKNNFILLIFAFISLSFSSYAQIPTDGLELYYPLNNDVIDQSGNSLDGNNFEATSGVDRFGNEGFAYQFNGVSSYLEVPDAPAIKPDFPFSISLWFKIDAFSTSNFRLYSSDLTDNAYTGFWLSCGNTGNLSAGYGNGNIGLDPINRKTKKMSYEVVEGIWYNYVAVFNDLNDIDLYLNCNAEPGEYSGGSTIMFNEGSDGKIGIGHVTSSYFNGLIDEVRVYGRALNLDEIESFCKERNPTLNIENFASNQKTLVTPNPTSNIVYLDFNKKSNALFRTVKVFNSTGKLVDQFYTGETKTLLETSNWGAAGLYLIQIIDNKTIETVKLVKK